MPPPTSPPPTSPPPPLSERTGRRTPWRPEAWAGPVVELARTEAVGGILLTVMVGVALLWANLPAHSSVRRGLAGRRPLAAAAGRPVRHGQGLGRQRPDDRLLPRRRARGRPGAGARIAPERPQRPPAGRGRPRWDGRRGGRLPGDGDRHRRGAGRGPGVGRPDGHRRGVHARRDGPARPPGPAGPPGVRPRARGGRRRRVGRRPGLRLGVPCPRPALGARRRGRLVRGRRARPVAGYGPRGGRTSSPRSSSGSSWPGAASSRRWPARSSAWSCRAPCCRRPPDGRPPDSRRPSHPPGHRRPRRCRPQGHRRPRGPSPVDRSPSAVLERVLNPVSILLVLPLFALANTGVDLGAPGLTSGASGSGRRRHPRGPAGRQDGRHHRGDGDRRPLPSRRASRGVRWSQLAGAAAMCGMGFTVPLLFATGVFAGHPPLVAAAQIGLLVGTAVAFVVGGAILFAAGRRPGRRAERPSR